MNSFFFITQSQEVAQQETTFACVFEPQGAMLVLHTESDFGLNTEQVFASLPLLDLVDQQEAVLAIAAPVAFLDIWL